MDTLYIGDIPSDYHFAEFNNNYIDLYNTDVILPNHSYTYYRVYLYDNSFYYDVNTLQTGSWTNQYNLTYVQTSSSTVYRRDFDSICFITFCFVLLGIFLLNLITSIIRKGGVLGGLL